MAGKSKPGKIHLRIIEVMKRFPAGISGGQIRQELEKEGLEPGDQTHLDRRKRDLKKWFVIEKGLATIIVGGKNRKVALYKYAGVRRKVVDQGQISLKERAEVIHGAHGRCQMCGKSVEQHGITLVVDHKKPRDWGGTNDRDNLWAICEECSAGKKAYFLISAHRCGTYERSDGPHSVHVRIGELLKAVSVGKRTSSQLIEVVAHEDYWRDRLRTRRWHRPFRITPLAPVLPS
jgi:hypothetical protein